MTSIPMDLDYDINHSTLDEVPPAEQRRNLNSLQEQQCRAHEDYQSSKLSGFTLRQLRFFGCFGVESPKPNDLSSQMWIHPLYRPGNWQNHDIESIGHGLPGIWDVWDNGPVQAAMFPVLHLASCYLYHCINEPWYDALLFGHRKTQTDQMKDGCPQDSTMYEVQSFHQRSDRSRGSHKALQMRVDFSDLNNKIKFRIASTNSRPEILLNGYCRRTPYLIDGNGEAVFRGAPVTISSDLALPLLLGLTGGELLAQQFAVAKTLLHETMHATGHYSLTIQNPPRLVKGGEPFFEDEAISELGRSWEASCFGGSSSLLYTRHFSEEFCHPVLGMIQRPYPDFRCFGDGKYTEIETPSRYRHHEKFQAGAESYRWPFPAMYFENVQQADFWVVQVAKFGPAVLQPLKTVGIRSIKQGGASASTPTSTPSIIISDTMMVDYGPPSHFDAKFPAEHKRWAADQRQKMKVDATQFFLRERELLRQRDAALITQRHRTILKQVNQAVQQNDALIQAQFLDRAAQDMLTGGQPAEIIDILMLSRVRVIRVRSLVLASRLKEYFNLNDRLSFATEATEEASFQMQQDGTLPTLWTFLLTEAEVEVRQIQEEMAAAAT